MRCASCFRGALCLLTMVAATTAAAQNREGTAEPSDGASYPAPARASPSADAPTPATPQCPGSVVAVRYSSVRTAKITIPVMVNHSGPYAFLLDTSSQVNILEPSLAEELHLDLRREIRMNSVGGSSSAQLVMPELIEVGPYPVSMPLSAVSSITRLRAIDRHIRGILGVSFLSNFDVLLDNARKLLCLDSSGVMRRSLRGEHVPLIHPPRPGSDAPVPELIGIRVRFEDDNSSAVLALDSGANVPIIFSVLPTRAVLRGGSVVGGPDQFFIALFPQIVHIGARFRIGTTFFAPVNKQEPGAWAGIDGLLPTALFHRVFISYSEHYAIFDPT